VLVLALIAAARQVAPAVEQPRAQPTAAPTVLPTNPPTAAPAVRMVVAYAAPGGDVLGPIVVPAAAVARFGHS
jgi:hypothetical protein